jgi:hypothetical protein
VQLHGETGLIEAVGSRQACQPAADDDDARPVRAVRRFGEPSVRGRARRGKTRHPRPVEKRSPCQAPFRLKTGDKSFQ